MKKELEQLLESPHNLMDWLQSVAVRSEEGGYDGNLWCDNNNPIADFLEEEIDSPLRISVIDGTVDVVTQDGACKTFSSDWIKIFIDGINSMGDYEETVSAEDCIKVLDGLTEEFVLL